ncbi:MAG: hypothetical protein LC101_02765, partial [Flavobacteriales bacterium]|nr:hypothetical protein [Flavobacteriales bacterium]
MKKSVLMLACIAFATIVWSQTKSDLVHVAPPSAFLTSSKTNSFSAPKTLNCTDTIRYPQSKEQIIGTSNFYTLDFWTFDNEAISQTFLLSGSSLSISKVEFFGRKSPNSSINLQVRASIYNVDGSNNPTTSLGSATITFNDTIFNYRVATFSSSINVSANYAVVIEPISTNGILELYVNNAAPSQSYDENLSRAKSTYYGSGAWTNIPTYTATFIGGPYDFEAMVAPIITYPINTNFTTSPTTACKNIQFTFTNTTTPSSILGSRMYNYNVFRTYFSGYPDSTYVWDTDDPAPLFWTKNLNYAYPNAGTYNTTLYTLGGFWANCLDFKTNTTVVLNAPATTSPISGSINVCAGSSQTYSVINDPSVTSYTWTLPSGWTGSSTTNSINVTAGSSGGTISVVPTNACGSATATVMTVNVTPLPATTSPISGSINVCAGSSQTYSVINDPSVTSYTWTLPSGWTGSSTTNSINVTAGSSGGTISVTPNNACGSGATTNTTVTVISAPSPTAPMSGSLSICAGSTNTYTVTNDPNVTSYIWTLPSGWTGSSTTNSINATASSTGGTISVVPTNACGSATATNLAVTVNQDNAGFSYPTNTICIGSPNSTPTTYTSGTFTSSPPGLVFANSNTGEIDLNSSNAGTYTITYTTSGPCINSSSQVINITNSPDATFSYLLPQYCKDAGNPSPIFSPGASAGTFSASPSGLVFVSTSTGVINMAASTPGTYLVTNIISASGACPMVSHSSSVVINPLPSVSITGNTSICMGNSTTLNGNGGVSYVWSTGSNSTSITVSPGSNTTYTVTATDNNGCTGTFNQLVTVNPNPTAGISGGNSVCDGNSVTLTGIGGTSYAWSTGASTDSITVSPNALTTYTVTVTDNNACTASATHTVVWNANPTVTLDAFPFSFVCVY